MGDESAADGFATFAFDPIGTGGRQEERRGFYERHPEWSLMGKMVLDTRHAIDALEKRPEIDPENIYLVGYAMGGMTALLTAAIDERVAGVVSVAGFTPFRTDTDAAGTGGVRRYSHLYGWLPRLGEFVGAESKIPVDFGEIIACIAPRLAIIMAPKGDWHATHADIVAAVDAARQAYELMDAESRLKLLNPDDWNRFTTEMQMQVITWLNSYL
jgi:pimeloyl-ACP methyl ester carboxylesterase